MTSQELKERQGWTLDQKIDHSLGVIEAFANRLGGVDKTYISFSGGKDSTVLFHLARKIYPDILGVFCNTGNEYPDIIRFVHQLQKDGANIQITHPKITPRQVWEQYGFPLISKEMAYYLHCVKNNPKCKTAQLRLGDGKFSISRKWRYIIDEPYMVHNICCDKLKKEPMKKFARVNGRFPILGVTVEESRLRWNDYLKNGGCNFFDKKFPKSQPLSIWTEKDIWEYIERFQVPVADIYAKGADRTGCVGCGFGACRKGDTRFAVLLKEYPKYYDMIMKYSNNGVTFREALRRMLATDGLYLPDEQPVLY